MVGGPDDYDGVFAAWALARIDAVIVQPSLPFKHALELAGKHRMISASSISPFVEAGGLFAYAPNNRGQSRKLAAYVDRILKGAKPADLPAEQPTEFVLAINLKTAKALQVTIPKSLLARADEVIQ
jgi:putative ABC transport system substrate-binding protein